MRQPPRFVDLASLSRHAADVEANAREAPALIVILARLAGLAILAALGAWAVHLMIGPTP